MPDETDIAASRTSFATTLWTQVVRAADPSSPARREALEALFAAYWRPLYAFARRRGASVEDAKDSVQGFLARVLEKDWLAAACARSCSRRPLRRSPSPATPRPN